MKHQISVDNHGDWLVVRYNDDPLWQVALTPKDQVSVVDNTAKPVTGPTRPPDRVPQVIAITPAQAVELGLASEADVRDQG